jgi:hypothetical protein
VQVVLIITSQMSDKEIIFELLFINYVCRILLMLNVLR